MACNLFLLIPPSWDSVNLVCPLFSLTVLIAGEGVVLTVCELPRSQFSTLADCWSLRLAMLVGEGGSRGAVGEGHRGIVDGQRASCLGRRNRDIHNHDLHSPPRLQ